MTRLSCRMGPWGVGLWGESAVSGWPGTPGSASGSSPPLAVCGPLCFGHADGDTCLGPRAGPICPSPCWRFDLPPSGAVICHSPAPVALGRCPGVVLGPPRTPAQSGFPLRPLTHPFVHFQPRIKCFLRARPCARLSEHRASQSRHPLCIGNSRLVERPPARRQRDRPRTNCQLLPPWKTRRGHECGSHLPGLQDAP